MKLVRFGPSGAERPGVLVDDETVIDASSVVRDFDSAFFASHGIERLREAVDGGSLPTQSASDERLGSPIARPPSVLCIGLNYRDHAAEAGMPIPAEPIIFGKKSNTVVGPDDDVLIPRGSERTDFEVELGLVIGSEARYLSDPAAAAGVIAGYATSHDISERSYQLDRGGQWIKGKSCETFNPLGPWLVTADEVGDPRQLGLRLWVDGELMQDGTTAEMVFDPFYLVWYLSQFMVLEPGDLINTGTPAGVGMGKKPPRYLRAGDVVELEVSGLGRQRQICRAAP
jgi:2-keto-4-pentenoate hydratase/2-oxohepta-3-ene-1,7-dioic acid hydratase in catechol pathway